MTLRILITIVAVFMTQLLGGCAMHETYGDPAMAQSERAVVEGYWHYRFLYDEELHIVSLDGGNNAKRDWPNAFSISLPSGNHWLQLALLRNGGEIARCAFEMNFAALHHYKITRLHHEQALLAHPGTSHYQASLTVIITAPDVPEHSVMVPAVCATSAMCRQKTDCPDGSSCHMAQGYDFGTCTVRER